MYYSKSTNGFYLQNERGVPDDLVEISTDHHAYLVDSQSSFMVIGPDADGRPILIGASRTDSVPLSVSRFQARRALKDAGVFDTVESAIAQADEFTQDAWAEARDFYYDSPMIVSLCEVLELDRDALFIAAAKIQA